MTFVMFLLSGCFATDDKSPTATPSAASRQIREFDFSNAEWFDTSVAETVELRDGSASRGAGSAISPMRGGGAWRIEGTAQYSDVDGDGDEDAAVGLFTSGEQSWNTGWYIWLWQDGSAVQLRQPVVSTTRCDRPIDSVTAVPGGFEVRAFLFQSGADSCAGGGAIPIRYVAGVREGWPVRISPEYGPLDTCDPLQLTERLHPTRTIQLRVATDERSPIVETANRYDSLLVDDLAVSPYLTREQKGDWVLALAVRGGKRVCGYAHVKQVF